MSHFHEHTHRGPTEIELLTELVKHTRAGDLVWRCGEVMHEWRAERGGVHLVFNAGGYLRITDEGGRELFYDRTPFTETTLTRAVRQQIKAHALERAELLAELIAPYDSHE